MRYPILSLLVAVCAYGLQGGLAEAQSRMGQAGGAVQPRGHSHRGGGHGGVGSPGAQTPHAHPQRHGDGGGSRHAWRPQGRSGRRSGGFGIELGIGGFGLGGGFRYGGWPGVSRGYSSDFFGYDYGPAYPPHGGYYYGPEGPYPFDEYGFSYGYAPPVISVRPLPQWGLAAPLHDPGFADPPLQDAPRWNQPLAVQPMPGEEVRGLAESSTAAKLKSVRAQGFGDQWFRQQQYQLARDRYKSAVQHAPDRAEARFRLAFAYAAIGAYENAVREIKLGLQLDPEWPSTGASLDALFGENNQVAKLSLISRVSTWAQEDPRDPDRLFLLGVLRYFNDEIDKALPLFEAARRFGGAAEHLQAFVDPAEPQLGAPVDVPPPPADAVAAPQPVERRERAEEFLPPLPAEAAPSAPAELPGSEPAEDGSAGPVLPPLPQP